SNTRSSRRGLEQTDRVRDPRRDPRQPRDQFLAGAHEFRDGHGRQAIDDEPEIPAVLIQRRAFALAPIPPAASDALIVPPHNLSGIGMFDYRRAIANRIERLLPHRKRCQPARPRAPHPGGASRHSDPHLRRRSTRRIGCSARYTGRPPDRSRAGSRSSPRASTTPPPSRESSSDWRRTPEMRPARLPGAPSSRQAAAAEVSGSPRNPPAGSPARPRSTRGIPDTAARSQDLRWEENSCLASLSLACRSALAQR